MFKEPVPNKVMTGHVIRKEGVPSEGRVLRGAQYIYFQINIGQFKGGKLECELNNATAEKKFVFEMPILIWPSR